MDLKPYTEAVKRKINLVDYIGAHIELKQKSGKHVACCPFHNEKTPSFYVHAEYFHCFGCQKHGDVFTFATDYLGKKFWETLEELAKKTGTELPNRKEESPAQKKKRADELRFFRILSDAAGFFKSSLETNEKTKSYLVKRGYSPEDVNNLPFGYAPATGPNLFEFLQKKTHATKDILALGLARPSKSGNGHYDFFRDRLMIRIDDEHGRPVAFGGRTLSEKGPKYINSPAHALFQKGEMLFNFFEAKSAIQKKRRAILCEGYMDVLKLSTKGFHEAVAVLGTAAGSSHLRLLERYAEELFVVFDGDEAGLRACRRIAADVAKCKNMRVRLLQLPDGHDPDSFVEELGAEKFEQALRDAPEFMEFIIEVELKDAQGKPPGALLNLLRKSVFTWIGGIKDPMHRDWMFTKVAKLAGIQKQLLMRGATRSTERSPNQYSKQNNHHSAPGTQQQSQGYQGQNPQENSQQENELRRYSGLTKLPILRSIVGSLLFAKPEERDQEKTRGWMDANLSYPGPVMEALHFLLANQTSVGVASDSVLDLTADWQRQLEPVRSQFEDRARAQMREVALRLKDRRLKDTIKGLKARLKSATETEDQRRLALEIQDLERARSTTTAE